MSEPGTEQSLSRREQQKQTRQEAILDAAAALFAQKGYHQTTVHDIAQQAGVADGTLYNYYESKFDLLIGILARISDLEQLPLELAQALRGDVSDFFVTAFGERMGRIEQGEKMIKALLPQALIDDDLGRQFYTEYVQRIARMLEGYISARIELGCLRPVDPQLLTRLIQATIVGMLVLRILGDEPLLTRWAEMPEFWAGVLFKGLAPRAEE